MGVQRTSSSHHHDLSDAVINRYNENAEKLNDVLKASDLFATADSHLVNIITKADMPDNIKEGVLTRDEFDQALFDTFVQERVVEAKIRAWSPIKKSKSQVMEVCFANNEEQAK